MFGLLKQTHFVDGTSEPAEIHTVNDMFQALNYGVAWRLIDTRKYLLPQRRTRVWIVALRDSTKEDADAVMEQFEELQLASHLPLDMFMKPDLPPQRPHVLREQEGLQRMRSLHPEVVEKDMDAFWDLSKSVARTDHCLDAMTCWRPNSKPYSHKRDRFADVEDKLRVQGIYAEDFPALHQYLQHETTLLSDLCGNAFAASVVIAVEVAILAAAPDHCFLPTDVDHCGAGRVDMYIHTYTDTYIDIHTYVRMYSDICTYVDMYIHTEIYIHTYIHTYVCTYVCMYVVHMYVCM